MVKAAFAKIHVVVMGETSKDDLQYLMTRIAAIKELIRLGYRHNLQVDGTVVRFVIDQGVLSVVFNDMSGYKVYARDTDDKIAKKAYPFAKDAYPSANQGG